MGEFDRFRALSFDCYGTLIDWEAGISAALEEWTNEMGVEIPRSQLLRMFSKIEPAVQQVPPPAPLYPEVLAEVMRRIGAEIGVGVSADQAARFGASVGDWPAFADSPSALLRLGRRFRLLIVSNVDRASFAATNRRLGVTFDRIITAEDVGGYKPGLAHFEALLAGLTDLDLERDDLVHVAQSLYHDHEPARRLGLPTIWIDRGRTGTGAATPAPQDPAIEPRWRFPSLTDLADFVEGGH